jgi:hypothetical protein
LEPDVLRALGLALDASDAQIADGLRVLAGLPPGGTTNASLWVRFLQGIEHARHGAGGAELGVPYAESDERLRMLVIDEIAPRLWDADLFYVINYV